MEKAIPILFRAYCSVGRNKFLGDCPAQIRSVQMLQLYKQKSKRNKMSTNCTALNAAQGIFQLPENVAKKSSRHGNGTI